MITSALLVTPNVTALPQVQALTGRSVLVVDTVFVLAFVAAGVLTMTAGGRRTLPLHDQGPRSRAAIVGFVAAHFSQLWCAKLIDLANALTAALTPDDLDRRRRAASDQRAQRIDRRTGQDGGAAVRRLRGHHRWSCSASTAFSMIVRFAVVLVLTASRPSPWPATPLPQTDPIARLWWRSYGGALAVPVVQGFTLYAGQWMLTDPDNLLPVLGLPGDPGGVIEPVRGHGHAAGPRVRMPGLMRRFVSTTGGGGGANILGMAVRVVVVQQADPGRCPAWAGSGR